MTCDGPLRHTVDNTLAQESVDDLYENAPCGYLSTTPDGLIVNVNQTFLAWSGYRRDELIGCLSFADLLRAGGKLFYETHVAPMLQMHGIANEIAFDLVCKDGRPLPVLIGAIQKRDPSGRPLFHRITVFNASERRRYEQELLRAKKEAERIARDLQISETAAASERDRLRQILDVLPVAVLIVDADERCTLANAAARQMMGCDGSDDASRAADRLTPDLRHADGTSCAMTETPLHRSLRRGESVRAMEALIRSAFTGRELPVLVSSAPLQTPNGAINGAVMVVQDVTPLKDMEKAREEFLGAAAHDLKAPLTSVQGLAQLAKRRLGRLAVPRAQPVMEQLTGIEDAARRMVTLINDLVDITRLQMGVLLELNRRPTDVLTLTRNVMAQQQGAMSHRLTLETDVPSLVADVDPDRIERVLHNLVGNAVKYSPRGGDIVVRAAREDEQGAPTAVLEVRDTGLGIPAADLPHIFERYYRAGNVQGHIQGTGIGLASVRQIVEQHGGRVTVASQEGVGTAVTVRLPLREARP